MGPSRRRRRCRRLIRFRRRRRRRLKRRAALLGTSLPTAAETAVAVLRDAVEQDLTAMALDLRLTLAELNELRLPELATAVRSESLDRLDAALQPIVTRLQAHRALPAADELRQWVTLWGTYNEVVALGGRELRRLAFAEVYPKTSSFAVWLFNKRQQKPLAHSILLWLYNEAEIVGDREAAALQRDNIALRV